MSPRIAPVALAVLLLGAAVCEAALRHGFPSEGLHVDREPTNTRTITVDAAEGDIRTKRDTGAPPPPGAPQNSNITTKINILGDGHQQLIVHWVGEGSSVIICLARDPEVVKRKSYASLTPSSLYISYDYGDTFDNKTELFTSGPEDKKMQAQLDKFYNHPVITSTFVFTDTANKMLFHTSDSCKSVRASKLSFTPSEIAFDEEDPDTFVILDKVDATRKLYLTRDGGSTFKLLEEYVKSFFWTSGADQPRHFYVERSKPGGSGVVMTAPKPKNYTFQRLIDDVQDFQIKSDFMFATRQNGKNQLDLYISYMRGPFVKAEFQTELDLREFHISDVTGTRIFVSVSHADTSTNLYVSEINSDFTEYKFVLSLESILCYFPKSTWKNSWLNDIAEESFADLYKVEGLRGIYIASKILTKPSGVNIGPEHLTSYITFDHGSTWSTLRAPEVDENGHTITCVLKSDCTLSVSQKFSQLYPVTRSATIMSSKSAPGIIMATGVIGKSLKGLPGVFISRDAGLTWKQVLKDHHFFNQGDHGGILVAVRYFKTRGETKEIFYSTDEGERWNTYEFHTNDLRVYGLMTEPGENTTVFTMFGSAKGAHQWIIIKVDLFKAFSYNCTSEDYKFWSPSSGKVGSKIPCLLGMTDTYQRRIPHANCYSGQNYDRPVKREVCECDKVDFECDFGFMPSTLPKYCIRNHSLNDFDPYTPPSDCKPGDFYNRTKGYRKIDGDQCVDGNSHLYLPDSIPCPMVEKDEFLIVSLRDKVARIGLNDKKLDIFPIKNLSNVIAVEFDMVRNCVYWADIMIDVIGRQCLNKGVHYPEILVSTDLASIEGMALDWISNVLFFVDGTRSKIEAIRTDISTEGRMRRTIINSDVLHRPRGIAVHPVAGYLFWTDWSQTSSSVSRANLDGTGITKLFVKPTVDWPNGITVDHYAERIYWVDASQDYIASSDLNGHSFKKILANEAEVSHPFAVAVFKDTMFWDDWKVKSIFSADKDHGIPIKPIKTELSGCMDLKVYSHSLRVGTNACASNKHNCQALCLGMPNGNFSCLCPDGLTMKDGKCICPGGKSPYSNMTCPRDLNTCKPNEQFSCANGVCIPSNWHCDGDDDCGDNSDENGCSNTTCSLQSFKCDINRCIPHYYRCDNEKDCLDGTDELGCKVKNCSEDQFQCKNGHCISNKWRCDGDDDCKDMSDEIDCKVTPLPCKSNEFKCASGLCVPLLWTCDGEHDCPDASDELKTLCKTIECSEWMFKCKGNQKCIYSHWVCDGEDDCKDGLKSDEANCTAKSTESMTVPTLPFPVVPSATKCQDWMFFCGSGECVPYWWKCDGSADCKDNSDEIGCGNRTIITVDDSKKTTHFPSNNGVETPATCEKNKFMCNNGECISASWVCDGSKDCEDGEDELHCSANKPIPKQKCADNQFMCQVDGNCIPLTSMCDGHPDCADKTDEQCESTKPVEEKCKWNEFDCNSLCIPIYMRCNSKEDCYGGLDEMSCTDAEKDAAQTWVTNYSSHVSTGNPATLTLFWKPPSAKDVTFEYMPSISETDGTRSFEWTNHTEWIKATMFDFAQLKPYTQYNMTVHVRIAEGRKMTVYPPVLSYVTRTGEAEPSPPLNVVVRQMTGQRVQVEWSPPTDPRGVVTEYVVMVTPPLPPVTITVQAPSNSTFIQQGDFKPEKTYTFWVVAKNSYKQSNASEPVTLEFDAVGDIDNMQNLLFKKINSSVIAFNWRSIRGIDGYLVKQRILGSYPNIDPIKVKFNNITLYNLSPGASYIIEVQAYKDNQNGKPLGMQVDIEGSPYSSVVNLRGVLINSTSVQLTWNRPRGLNSDNVKYGIYYGLDMKELLMPSTVNTSDTSYTLKDLHSCASYLLNVGLVYPGLGPIVNKSVSITTKYNPRSPVKNLTARQDARDQHKMVITWESSCDTKSDNVTYIVSVTELTLNKTTEVRLTPTSNSTLSHSFINMSDGGKYNVSVKTTYENSIPASVVVDGPPLPPPHQIKVLRDMNGAYLLYWEHHNIPETLEKESHYYEVLVKEDGAPGGATVMKVFNPPVSVPDLHPGASYSISVRFVTEKGYMSPVSEEWSLHIDKEEWEATSASRLPTYIGFSLGIIALGTCIALAVLAVKHRRLSNSFVRFASPRYDNRSETACLGGHPGMTALDDDDPPAIRGFADDEPLVVA